MGVDDDNQQPGFFFVCLLRLIKRGNSNSTNANANACNDVLLAELLTEAAYTACAADLKTLLGLAVKLNLPFFAGSMVQNMKQGLVLKLASVLVEGLGGEVGGWEEVVRGKKWVEATTTTTTTTKVSDPERKIINLLHKHVLSQKTLSEFRVHTNCNKTLDAVTSAGLILNAWNAIGGNDLVLVDYFRQGGGSKLGCAALLRAVFNDLNVVGKRRNELVLVLAERCEGMESEVIWGGEGGEGVRQ